MLCPVSFDCLDLASSHRHRHHRTYQQRGPPSPLPRPPPRRHPATAASSSAGREGELLNTTRLVNNGSKQRRHGTREVASGLLGNSREGISGNFAVGGSNNDGREGGNEVLLLGSGKVGQR
mmetsp:Transcript_3064/g.7030  ORF Transcript_3064/g.7030 Transcript_3064/m.7030 type:complete len:121 (+) Transcript_3064:223-585(+)